DQIAVIVDVAKVAGLGPTVDEGRLRGGLVAPVAARVGLLAEDLADDVLLGDLVPVLVAQLHVRAHAADAARLQHRLLGAGGDADAPFGHAVGVAQAHVRPQLHGAHDAV